MQRSPEQMQDTVASTQPQQADGSLVARNALYLTIGQVLTVPIAVALNAVAARYLGSVEFGYIYLATTICGFGLLAIQWGQQGSIPALIARDRSQAGALLGTCAVWQLLVAFGMYFVLAAGCILLGYTGEFQWALVLTLAMLTLNSVAGAYKDTMRGFERTDVPAVAHVGQQLLAVAVVIPVLMLGGGMRGILSAQIFVTVVVILLLWRALRPMGVDKLSFQRSMVKPLVTAGAPFVLVDLAMLLQPNIDAIFLSKLAPPEAMGWFGVSRRLIGLLLFPATALIGALYPTLCRLHETDKQSFDNVARGAIYGVAVIVVPIALGCGLYPEVGVSFFSRKSFGPAEANLRILAGFLFLVYFTMPLGTAVLAAGKRRAWGMVQSVCVVVSLVLDPLLVPYFQRRFGNGGLGLCVAAVVSEAVVVACGVALSPRSIFDRSLRKAFLLTALSGGAMVGVSLLCRPLSPFLGAPLSVVAYGATLWLTGGIDRSHLQVLPGFKRFTRAR